ncbi:hypothetical protein F4677DRAFT_361638 [Hypoxylon crocopeplum]|nr:hypothetical protein F4677DRAFT_361638 [Hypoxylon crocopeplum]
MSLQFLFPLATWVLGSYDPVVTPFTTCNPMCPPKWHTPISLAFNLQLHKGPRSYRQPSIFLVIRSALSDELVYTGIGKLKSTWPRHRPFLFSTCCCPCKGVWSIQMRLKTQGLNRDLQKG